MSRPGGRRAAAPLIKDPQRYKARRRPPAGARAASQQQRYIGGEADAEAVD